MNVKNTIFCIIILMAISLSLGVACAGENISSTHPELLSVEESPIDVESEPVEIDNDVSTTEENDILSSSPDEELTDEIQKDDSLSATEEPIFELHDGEVLSENEGSFTELQNLIDSANSGSVVELTKNYGYKDGDSKSGVVINKDLTINGNYHVLDGKDQSRIFYLNGSSLILNNLKFINGNGTEKSYYYGSDDFYYIGPGGAINCKDGNLSITNCTFENNVAAYGGAIYTNAHASMFGYVETNYMKITNSYFNNNFAYSSGGAVEGDIIEIYDSEFNNNFASYTSGGVFGNNIIINNSIFNNNSVFENLTSHYSYPLSAGAVYIGYNGTVSNSKFISNKARYGGAIFSSFNYALTYDSETGTFEDIDLNLSLKLKNNIFENNLAYLAGGAVFVLSKLIDDGSKFYNNLALKEGGAIYSSSRGIELSNSDLINNTAMYGGALASINITSLDDINLDNNKAFYGDDIAFNSSKISLNVDNRRIYKFINPLESSNFAKLSDGYTAFIEILEFEDYGDYQYIASSYPYIDRHLFSQEEYRFLIYDMYFLANYSDINNGFDFVLNCYLDEIERYGSNEYVDEKIYTIKNLMFFIDEKWAQLKLNKTRELLNDPTISDEIPDHGYVRQINSTTFAFLDFEVLEAELQTRQYIKGPGYFTYWAPAYKLEYKSISEVANLTVEKISLNPTVNVGEVSSFDIIVKNTGLINLTGVFVSELIPEGLTYISHSDSDVWIKTGDIFNYLKTLGVNETVRFTIDFNTTKVGNFTNVIIAGSNETGNKTANNTTEVINKTDVPENKTEIPEETPGNNTVVENDYPTGEDVDLRNDYAMGPVEDNDTPADESSSENKTQNNQSETPQNGEENVKVDKNATGNPIFLVVLVLLASLITLRRRD